MLVITLVHFSEISALPISLLRYRPKILIGSTDIEDSDSLTTDYYMFTRHPFIYSPVTRRGNVGSLVSQRNIVLLTCVFNFSSDIRRKFSGQRLRSQR
jgi:hypothetical protein